MTDKSTLTLASGRVLSYEIHDNKDYDDDYKSQIEFDDMSLTIVSTSDCTDDYIEMCVGNSGQEVGHFLVAEYIGSESQSENWSPDLETTGLSDNEIMEVLMMFDDGIFDNG